MRCSTVLSATLVTVLTVTMASTATARSAVTSLLEMRQADMVIQDYDLSCGAAALATVLHYQHGLPISEKEIAVEMLDREEYRADPQRIQAQQGFSLLDLKKFVDGRGLSGEGYGQVSFDDLLKLAPAIVPVSFDGYDHFVVFRGIVGDQILVADPAWGNRVLRRSRFDEAWIELPELGRVAFVVKDPDGNPAEHDLLPSIDDFSLLR